MVLVGKLLQACFATAEFKDASLPHPRAALRAPIHLVNGSEVRSWAVRNALAR